MNADDGFLAQIIAGLSRTIAPISNAASSPEQFARLLERLGWPAPVGTEVAAQLHDVAVAIDQIVDDVDSGAGSAALLLRIAEVFAGLAALRDVAGTPSAGAPFDDPMFWNQLPNELIALLISESLEADAPGLYGVLSFLGVLRKRSVAADPSSGRNAYIARTLDWTALGRAVASPGNILTDVYGWGETFDHVAFLEALYALGAGLGGAVALLPVSSEYLAQLVNPANPDRGRMKQLVALPAVSLGPTLSTLVKPALIITALPPAGAPSDPPEGLLISPVITGAAQAEIRLRGGAILTLTGDFQTSPLRVGLRPGGATLESSQENVDVAAHIDIAPTQPVLLGGIPDGTRFEFGRAHLGFIVQGSTGDLEVVIDTGFDEAHVVLDLAQADGFLRGVLGVGPYKLSLPVDLTWSSTTGLRFSGGAIPEIHIPVHLVFASMLTITAIEALIGSAETEDTVMLRVAASGSLIMGPLLVSFDGIGVQVEVRTATLDAPGNFGLLDLALGLKPPDGIGLAIHSGPISGGGFLYIDPHGGGYAGVLELDLLKVGISAFGIINTKLPDGGWSLFLALYIDLPSIPLGFGFTLNGVGGVAGINRTLDVESLRSAIRSGSLDAVLFPEDPIADAPMIIDAVQAIFPSAEGRYIFGPVIQIGWGTPTLIEAEIGIVISLPDPIVIAILGSVTSVLPTRDVDLVALHLEVAGVIDMGAATLSIDASLHGSHMARFPLSGDMALRGAFGDAPTFLMALGGSHPGFDRPAHFPEIARLSLAINAGALINIRFACYFAITSNSLQFGAAFELTAEVEGFRINGGAEFDALIILSPFSLQTHLGYHVSVEAAGVDLLAVWLDVMLSGPNPWHVIGTATFTLLGIDNTIKLDQIIGAKEREELPETEDVLEQFRAAVTLPEAWSVGPGGGRDVVVAAHNPLSDELVVPPDGTLGVSQRVVPLEITIDKSEPWQIEGGYNWFDLEANEPGMASTGVLTDWFAVSSYLDLSPREQLSAPSFERLKSGIEFGGGEVVAGSARRGTLNYEQILRDPKLDDATVKLSPHNLSTDPRAGTLAEMPTSQVAGGFSIADDDAPIKVVSPGFAVTDRRTGTVRGRERRWTASRSSSVGRKRDVTIVPAWEVAYE